MDPIAKGRSSWKEEWKNPAFRINLLIPLFFLFLFAIFLGPYFEYIDVRNGPELKDFILDLIPAEDVSGVLFFFLYSGILLGLFALRHYPRLFILLFQTYVIATIARLLCIYLIPLNPPDQYIPLKEPVVQLFTTNSHIISHDLFFSGHVLTICCVLFVVRNGLIKKYLYLCTIMVTILVLVQHNHYVIDVIAAPIATYLSFIFARKYLNRF